ncbi:Rad52/22 family double-strand break repair protein-domain-containing protein [Mycena galericulata]|nr:Rad52/22 family double-strand break repair protein-domain-containing protein [Mycena galericulata]
MAGALSGHIINSYESSVSNQSICTDGLISFAPGMHGAFNPNMHSTQPFLGSVSMGGFSNPLQASTSMCESTYERVNRLQAKLNQKLGPEFISQRPGPGGGPKLTYAEGWKVINVANEVFGFDGWSSNIVSLTTDYLDFNEETRRYNVGVSAVMRVTLKEGVFHEDVGYGMIENAKAKGMALDKCKKEAVTDGLKRTLRTFGNVLGNCLYDKQYTAEIVKIKVPLTIVGQTRKRRPLPPPRALDLRLQHFHVRVHIHLDVRSDLRPHSPAAAASTTKMAASTRAPA